MKKRNILRLPVVSLSAEYLVMGYLMRRNILTYKAPPNNEGYDLICIHPDPRRRPAPNELHRVLVQVKSRYATDGDRSVFVKETSLDAFDFLIVAFLNIGKFFGSNDGTTGQREPEFYTLSREFVRQHFETSSTLPRLRLRKLEAEIKDFKGEAGFDLIADKLGILRPKKGGRATSLVGEDE